MYVYIYAYLVMPIYSDLSIYLSEPFSLSIHPSIHPSICVSLPLYVHTYMHRNINISIYIYICLSKHTHTHAHEHGHIHTAVTVVYLQCIYKNLCVCVRYARASASMRQLCSSMRYTLFFCNFYYNTIQHGTRGHIEESVVVYFG